METIESLTSSETNEINNEIMYRFDARQEIILISYIIVVLSEL